MSKKQPVIDLHKGGKVKLQNGKTLKIEPSSERVFLSYWLGNGVMMEVLCYSEQQPGHVNSDRIHLLITDGNGERCGWLMNREDAQDIIIGLTRGIQQSERMGIPWSGD